MTIKNGDTPAMAAIGQISNTNEVWSFQVADNNTFQFTGMTKREMMAMHMMQGLVANSSGGYSDYKYMAMAEDAVRIAGALLAELERTK